MKVVLAVSVLLSLAAIVSSSAATTNGPSLKSYELVREWTFSPRTLALSFVAYDRTWSFLLQPSQFVNVTGALLNKYYTGILADEPTSLASFTIGRTEISGLWILKDDTFHLVQLKHEGLLNTDSTLRDVLGEDQLIVYRSRDVDSGDNFLHCNYKHLPDALKLPMDRSRRDVSTPKTLALYIDQAYNTNGGPDPVGVLNDVNLIYTRSGIAGFNINFQGVSSFSADGSDINNDINSWKTWVSTTWDNSDTQWDNVFLLTGQPYGWAQDGGGAIGIAYIGSTCSGSQIQTSWKTGLAGLPPSGVYNKAQVLQEIAHELGHNRSNYQTCQDGVDCNHDQSSGCWVMTPMVCDTTGGVQFSQSWRDRMC